MAAQTVSSTADVAEHESEHTRRDFLVIASAAFAAVGGGAALWPLLAATPRLKVLLEEGYEMETIDRLIGSGAVEYAEC